MNPDAYKATLQLGDTLMLCTDGMSKYVPDDRIADILRHKGNAEETCLRLVSAANDLGSPDNVTVVVAHFRDAQQSAAHAAQHAAVADVVG